MADNFVVTITLAGNDQASPQMARANQQLQQLGRTATDASRAGKETTASFSQFNDVLGQVGLGLSVVGFVRGATELQQLGQEANIAEHTFNALAGGEEAAAVALERMRAATRGTVDDMTLMNSASRLLMMGLAENTTQAAELSEMAVTLGRAMGHDASESMESFSLLLANQSILRLDTFGISAARVRDRIEELKAAGIDAQEAFTMATLEIGRQAMTRLGDAAGQSASPVQQLGIVFQNMAQDVGQAMAGVANQAAQTVLDIRNILGLLPQIAAANSGVQSEFAQAGSNAAASFWAAFGNSDAMRLIGDENMAQEILADVFSQLEEGATLNDALDVTGRIFFDVPPDVLAAYEQLVIYAYEYDQAQRNINTTIERQREIAADINATALEQATTLSFQQQEQAYIRQQQLADEHDMIMENGAASLNELQAMSDAYSGFIGGVELFTPEQAATAREIADEAQRLADSVPELEAQGQIFSEAEVDALNRAADDADRMATAAERGAQAFANMRLADVFQQEEGGMAGQISDDLLALAEQQGMSEEDLAALQATLDEASGRINEASQGYQEDVLPMLQQIQETFGDEALTQAIQNLEQFYQEAALQGLTPEQIAEGQERATGFSDDSGELQQIQNFDPVEYADSMAEADDSMANISASSEELRDALIASSPVMADITANASAFHRDAAAAAGTLARLSEREIVVNVRLRATGDTSVLNLAQQVQDNGGSVPGADGRVN